MTLGAEILLEEIKERGWNLPDACAQCGFENNELGGIITGRIRMSEEIAGKLSNGLGTSSDIWLKLFDGGK
jgi:plasmid maintenance system antidote protein VapI